MKDVEAMVLDLREFNNTVLRFEDTSTSKVYSRVVIRLNDKE